MPDQTQEILKQFTVKVSKLPSGKKRRYPKEIRKLIETYARMRLKQGASHASIYNELKISASTLTNALSKKPNPAKIVPKSPSILPIKISPTVIDTNSQSNIVVRTSTGISIEGLDLYQVVELLRAL